jgi:cell wall-associated NlpC family hydrolase
LSPRRWTAALAAGVVALPLAVIILVLGTASGGTGAPAAAGTTSQAASVAIAYARAQIGKPYKYGATGPETFDCSGLVMRALQAAGIGIPRTSEQQYAWGPPIPASQVQPGDLVFFTGDPIDPPPGHVGIVVAPGMMIDALQTGTPVQEQPFSAAGTPTGFTDPLEHAGVMAPP